ncbi:MAG: TlpA disulfide reductase family protein [Rhodoferax sp.]
MTANFPCWSRLRRLAGLLALLGSGAWAQGFDVQPWPPRMPVPALQASDLTGKVWRLADLRGKAVLINFWASWCEPCRAEMPSLQALAQRQGAQKLVVLAVNFKESATTATQFAQRSGLTLPVLLDPQGAIARQWGVRIFPSTVLIGSDGRVRAVVRGGLDWGGADAAALWEPLLETSR